MLVNSDGRLKIADFGLSREFNERLNERYTHKVVTLWYRPPEILLGTQSYKCAVDLWSVGVVFAELSAKKPFLQGKNELSQLDMIFRWCGSPSEAVEGSGATWAEHVELPFYESLKSICMKPQKRECALLSPPALPSPPLPIAKTTACADIS